MESCRLRGATQWSDRGRYTLIFGALFPLRLLLCWLALGGTAVRGYLEAQLIAWEDAGTPPADPTPWTDAIGALGPTVIACALLATLLALAESISTLEVPQGPRIERRSARGLADDATARVAFG